MWILNWEQVFTLYIFFKNTHTPSQTPFFPLLTSLLHLFCCLYTQTHTQKTHIRKRVRNIHTHTHILSWTHMHNHLISLVLLLIATLGWNEKGFQLIIKNQFILFHPLCLSSYPLPVLPLVPLHPSIILSPPVPPDSITSINLFLWLQCLCSVDDLSGCACVCPSCSSHSVLFWPIVHVCVFVCIYVCALHSFGPVLCLFPSLFLALFSPFVYIIYASHIHHKSMLLYVFVRICVWQRNRTAWNDLLTIVALFSVSPLCPES